MPSRVFRWFILTQMTLWLGVLVPAHNRGEIVLPWAGPSAAVATGCCDSHAKGDQQDDDPASPPFRTSACAICSFVRGLDAPPPATFVHERLGLVGSVAKEVAPQLKCAVVLLPYHSRAPPAA